MIKNYYDEAGHPSSTRRKQNFLFKIVSHIYPIEVEINRKDMLNSSIRHFSNQPLSTIRHRVQVSFLNEFGMDGGNNDLKEIAAKLTYNRWIKKRMVCADSSRVV